MTAPFDIFEHEKTGTVLWLGSAATIEEAKARVGQFSSKSTGAYLILNQKTGDKVVIKVDDADGTRADAQ